MVLGGYRYGVFPDEDHTRGGGGLRTRSADPYMPYARVSNRYLPT